MKYLSLFSGIGGFELGIEQAYANLQNLSDTKERQPQTKDSTSVGQRGVESDRQTRLGNPVCIGYSEIDKYAISIYEKHFGHKNWGDATTIKTDSLPDFDLLVGGFPCQSFSIAGKRGGFEDTRGTLFFEIARILRAKQPRLFVLENVKGLLSHDTGTTFKIILSTLTDLGYDLQWQVLNSKNHGVPQNRERIFIIGNLRGTSRPKVFPLGESRELSFTQRLDTTPSISALTATDYKGASKQRPNLVVPTLQEITKNVSDAQRVYDPKGIAKTLKGLGGGLGAKTGMYKTGDMKIRRLTPTECARLQGFPDDWHEGVSDTQAYKCYGNAVTVNVVQDIMERLLDE